jgi:hypothetical protein
LVDEQRLIRARGLLNNELFIESFETLEQNIKDSWFNTSVRDSEAREHLWLSLRLLGQIRLHLTSILETGEMAKKLEEYHL